MSNTARKILKYLWANRLSGSEALPIVYALWPQTKHPMKKIVTVRKYLEALQTKGYVTDRGDRYFITAAGVEAGKNSRKPGLVFDNKPTFPRLAQ